MNGHTEDRCFKRINEQLQGKPSQANAVQEVPQLDSGIVQFAGSASLRSLHPSDPLSPLQLDADVDWNAGTGATSLMTPHHHWLCNYKPHVVPVRLADSQSSIQLELGVWDNSVWFCAVVNNSNCTFLQGSTAPITEFAQPVTTLPLDSSFWHHRLCHHHHAGIQRLMRENMVIALQLDSDAKPDPLPVSSHSGMQYFITFIDDATSWKVVYTLHLKSQALEVFKRYKAYAENATISAQLT
ncbi:hypothetical protein EW146_g2577 [Bondarzewia mesenterica]|uniref:GAG-pre-integrase domain-containing protein n=1 Tax=Bondarzewia mesenterica TaxID=1095465 RepID=A0A4S4M0F6_9AGAM|nr:hypothetical protein EW146_g2577 [Bondarzewia mesenterica]